jgi:hypothetical protein
VRSVGALQDDAVDAAPVQEVPEDQPGRSRTDDHHVRGAVDGGGVMGSS